MLSASACDLSVGEVDCVLSLFVAAVYMAPDVRLFSCAWIVNTQRFPEVAVVESFKFPVAVMANIDCISVVESGSNPEVGSVVFVSC